LSSVVRCMTVTSSLNDESMLSGEYSVGSPLSAKPVGSELPSKLPLSRERDHCLTIGVDLGGINLRIAGFTPRLDYLAGIALPTRAADGPEAVVLNMCNAIRRVREECGADRELIGVGIGSPGPLELPSGRFHHPPNLPGFDGFCLREAVEANLARPVIVENDANAAALAEWNSGAGYSVPHGSMCMLTLGTGVGGGIILNGKIWHGMAGMGGEAGHLPLVPDGLPCGCGGRGCLEQYASATAVVRAAREIVKNFGAPGIARLIRDKQDVTARDLAVLAQGGDEQARELFSRVGQFLGKGLASLVNVLGLQLYVLGGGMIDSWDLFAPKMFDELRSLSYVYRLTEPADPGNLLENRTYVVPALLGTGAGLLGAAILPLIAAKSGGLGRQ
jgi:glucokinase